MLKKAEIAAWPRLPVPKYNKTDYAAAVMLRDAILQVDIAGEDGSFVRCACDGRNVITMVCEGNDVRWRAGKPSGFFSPTWDAPEVTCKKEQTETCRRFLAETGTVSDWRLNLRNNVVELLDLFVEEKRREERDHQYTAKWNLFREHQRMFPEMPKDLGDWCEERGVYTGKYLFIGKSDKGKRRVACSCCGKKYTITSGRHREWTTCRRCKQKVQMIGDWYDLRLEEKAYVIVPPVGIARSAAGATTRRITSPLTGWR